MDTESVQSSESRAKKAQGTGLFGARAWVLLAALVLSTAAAAQTNSVGEYGALRRHGSAARLLWVPAGASVRLDGAHLSAGLALGLRGTTRATLGPVAPALVFETGHRTSLTLMAVGGRGAMLVWQRRE